MLAVMACATAVELCPAAFYTTPQFGVNHVAMKGHQIAPDACRSTAAGATSERHADGRGVPPGRCVSPGLPCCRRLLLFAGGFALFASHVSGLATPENPGGADAIIVLTGGQSRLDAALDLLEVRQGRAAADQRRQSRRRAATTLRAATGGDKRCSPAASTSTTPRSTRSAMPRKAPNGSRSHAYGRVILVTNNYHMPRSLLEMGRLLGEAELGPIRWSTAELDDGGWMIEPDALRVLFTEYNKYLAALARGVVPPQPPTASSDWTRRSTPSATCRAAESRPPRRCFLFRRLV